MSKSVDKVDLVTDSHLGISIPLFYQKGIDKSLSANEDIEEPLKRREGRRIFMKGLCPFNPAIY